MAKPKNPHFFCTSCGHEEAKWFGRCSGCGAWNSAAEAPAEAPAAKGGKGAASRGGGAARARWAPAGGGEAGALGRSSAGVAGGFAAGPRPLADIEAADVPRVTTGLAEMDRVLGGGVVPGSLILVGGDPGIGKSTLLLQLARRLAADGRRVLYVSGEESERQVRLRAERLGVVPPSLLLYCETEIETVLDAASRVSPEVMIADSVQTLTRGDLEGGPGSVTQVRECGLSLMHYAKATGTAVFLVGHVTKDGSVAGPRVLEHMVDAVLYLEGERYQHYRVLRAAKNRFGATHELGVFEMTDTGLREVANPSEAFLSRGSADGSAAPGSAVVASLEGSRPLLVEVQALVSSSFYGTPQRVTNGFDAKRLAVLLAVLERRVGLRLGRHDVFVTVTGGISLDEPGTDLGVALAVASSFRSRPVLPRTLAIGEVSLSGELRRVSRLDARVHEAARLGFARAGVPAAQADELKNVALEVIPLATLADAIEELLGEKVALPKREGAGARGQRAEGAGADGADAADPDRADAAGAKRPGAAGPASGPPRAEGHIARRLREDAGR
jgi:DNA repair protein RadA/Sms